jgi:hypothetical protein
VLYARQELAELSAQFEAVPKPPQLAFFYVNIAAFKAILEDESLKTQSSEQFLLFDDDEEEDEEGDDAESAAEVEKGVEEAKEKSELRYGEMPVRNRAVKDSRAMETRASKLAETLKSDIDAHHLLGLVQLFVDYNNALTDLDSKIEPKAQVTGLSERDAVALKNKLTDIPYLDFADLVRRASVRGYSSAADYLDARFVVLSSGDYETLKRILKRATDDSKLELSTKSVLEFYSAATTYRNSSQSVSPALEPIGLVNARNSSVQKLESIRNRLQEAKEAFEANSSDAMASSELFETKHAAVETLQQEISKLQQEEKEAREGLAKLNDYRNRYPWMAAR